MAHPCDSHHSSKMGRYYYYRNRVESRTLNDKPSLSLSLSLCVWRHTYTHHRTPTNQTEGGQSLSRRIHPARIHSGDMPMGLEKQYRMDVRTTLLCVGGSVSLDCSTSVQNSVAMEGRNLGQSRFDSTTLYMDTRNHHHSSDPEVSFSFSQLMVLTHHGSYVTHFFGISEMCVCLPIDNN